MLKFRIGSFVLGCAAFAALASADSFTVQLGAGSHNFTGTGIPDTVQDSGAIITPTLTLNVPTTLTFYTALYGANCTSCTGSGNLTANLIATDTSPSGTGSGTFSQPFSDSVSGSTHTFTPLAGSPIDIALSNGDTLMITPLAGVADAVTTANGSESISATFLLTKTTHSSVPEPSSALLLLTGLGFAGFLVRGKFSISK